MLIANLEQKEAAWSLSCHTPPSLAAKNHILAEHRLVDRYKMAKHAPAANVVLRSLQPAGWVRPGTGPRLRGESVSGGPVRKSPRTRQCLRAHTAAFAQRTAILEPQFCDQRPTEVLPGPPCGALPADVGRKLRRVSSKTFLDAGGRVDLCARLCRLRAARAEESERREALCEEEHSTARVAELRLCGNLRRSGARLKALDAKVLNATRSVDVSYSFLMLARSSPVFASLLVMLLWLCISV